MCDAPHEGGEKMGKTGDSSKRSHHRTLFCSDGGIINHACWFCPVSQLLGVFRYGRWRWGCVFKMTGTCATKCRSPDWSTVGRPPVL